MKKKNVSEFITSNIDSLNKVTDKDVKKLLVQALVQVCHHVKKKVYKASIYPLVIKLCNDTHFGVRKVCAENLAEFIKAITAKFLPSKDRIVEIMMIVDKYIKDESKFIRNTIYREFGNFIYQVSLYDLNKFGKKIDKLIVTYIEEKDNQAIEDPDFISLQVAYNMP